MYVGVDGCRGGWIAVGITARGKWQVELFTRISQLVKHFEKARVILVDIPIGLISKPRLHRNCDKLARRLLSPKRHSSVFPAPVRAVLKARNYRDACRISAAEIGVQLSLQSYNILSRIAEVDRFLKKNPDVPVFESHPEVAFTSLGGRPMNHHKKTKKGKGERVTLLNHHFSGLAELQSSVRSRFKHRVVADDDILDAMVLAVMARVARGKLSCLPSERELDKTGRPMQILFYDKQLRFQY